MSDQLFVVQFEAAFVPITHPHNVPEGNVSHLICNFNKTDDDTGDSPQIRVDRINRGNISTSMILKDKHYNPRIKQGNRTKYLGDLSNFAISHTFISESK